MLYFQYLDAEVMSGRCVAADAEVGIMNVIDAVVGVSSRRRSKPKNLRSMLKS